MLRALFESLVQGFAFRTYHRKKDIDKFTEIKYILNQLAPS